MKRLLIALILLVGTVAPAAEPPEYINYQGVLRDADDNPLDASPDMVFRFYDAETLGNLLLTDGHNGVGVSGGLFNVHLGAGFLTPGIHTTLAEVFADQQAVWLEVAIGAEVLSPRIRVIAAAYALNAGRLDGKGSSDFLDTSSTDQTKAGQLTITTESPYGIDAVGASAGARFRTAGFSGWANVADGEYGIRASGGAAGGVLEGNRGVEALGSDMGGYFQNTNSLGEARIAWSNHGIWASGPVTGIEGQGQIHGGWFKDSDDTGEVMLGSGNQGVWAVGSAEGGYFKNTSNNNEVHAAWGDYGIYAKAVGVGGYFEDSNGTGRTNVGIGNRGIEGYGSEMGGYFKDSDHSGYAEVGIGDAGINGYGSLVGGYFESTDPTGGHAYVGRPLMGISAWGPTGVEGIGNPGGHFYGLGEATGVANLAIGDRGIEGFGSYMGAYFKDTDDLSDAKVAFGGYGIRAYGNTAGGTFQSLTTGNWSEVGGSTYKVTGNGANPSFVQNHPERADRVIVYAAPEGNEIATYTRGTARLVAGEARIPLDESFKWVTNPDIGLTGHLTPQGECNGIYVDSLSTEELLVRELGDGGSDVVFDYIVWGLRIGFEELPVIQEKSRDAYLPKIDSSLAVYEKLPELRRHNALERFRAMRVANGQTTEVDLSAALSLKHAIGIYDPAIHGVDSLEMPGPPEAEPSEVADRTDSRTRPAADSARAARHPGAEGILSDKRAPQEEARQVALTSQPTQYPTSEPVEVGDLVALDRERPGHLRRASQAADPAVFGIAAGEAELVDEGSQVGLVESRYAQVKADASYGAILPGDLLVSSPTPGHVMRAVAPLPGTIVGKAAESLDTGTGLINVLVMLR